MSWAKLAVTDGTSRVDLIKDSPAVPGFHLDRWVAQVAGLKGGGVWRASPLSDGRQLVMRRWENVLETFTLKVAGASQDAVARETQDLRRLLEQARDFWQPRSPAGCVWIEAQSAAETHARYAVIYDYATPADEEPYGGGFTGPVPLLAPWPLIVERGHWLDHPPLAPGCLTASAEFTGQVPYLDLIANGGFETAGAGGADVFAGWIETAGTGAIAADAAVFCEGAVGCRLTGGAAPRTTNVTQNVAVSPGQVLEMHICHIAGTGVGRYRVIDNTHGADIVPLTIGVPAVSVISVPAGCVSIGIVLQCPNDAAFCTFDAVQLLAYNPVALGQTATCEPEALVACRESQATLTHAYFWDGAAFSTNLMAETPPFDLFPGATDTDILYLGVQDLAPVAGPFASVAFDLAGTSTLATNQGVWEYYDGGAWEALEVADTTRDPAAGLYPFTRAGVSSVLWRQPDDWETTQINGVVAWWVRFRITAADVLPAVQQAARLHCIVPNCLAVPGSGLGGDLAAAVQHVIASRGNGGNMTASRLIVATRQDRRGANFRHIINLSEAQPVAGITITPAPGGLTFETASDAPTGELVRYDPGAAGTHQLVISIDTPLAEHYEGTFRAFLRIRQTSAMAGVFDMRLITQARGIRTSEVARSAASGDYEVVDLGVVAIPVNSAGDPAPVRHIQLVLEFTNSLAGAWPVVDLFDLALIPIDEWAAEVRITAAGIGFDYEVLLDATYPRYPTLYDIRPSGTGGDADAGRVIQLIAASPPVLAPGEDQRVYLYDLGADSLWAAYTDALSAHARYFSLRGDR